jgi:hypothetical protein
MWQSHGQWRVCSTSKAMSSNRERAEDLWAIAVSDTMHREKTVQALERYLDRLDKKDAKLQQQLVKTLQDAGALAARCYNLAKKLKQ